MIQEQEPNHNQVVENQTNIAYGFFKQSMENLKALKHECGFSVRAEKGLKIYSFEGPIDITERNNQHLCIFKITEKTDPLKAKSYFVILDNLINECTNKQFKLKRKQHDRPTHEVEIYKQNPLFYGLLFCEINQNCISPASA